MGTFVFDSLTWFFEWWAGVELIVSGTLHTVLH